MKALKELCRDHLGPDAFFWNCQRASLQYGSDVYVVSDFHSNTLALACDAKYTMKAVSTLSAT